MIDPAGLYPEPAPPNGPAGGPAGTPGAQYHATTDSTNPSTEMPWPQFAQNAPLTANQLQCAQQLGCFGLMYAWLGIIPKQGSGGAQPAYPTNPMTIPGMTMFGSYAAAQQYCAEHTGSWMIAYQFQYAGPQSTTPWQPPTAGQL